MQFDDLNNARSMITNWHHWFPTDALQAIVNNPVAVAAYDITTGWPA